MKKLFLSALLLSLLCACGSEEPVVKRPSYDPLLPLVGAASSLESLAVIALCVEGSAADAAAIAYGDELPQEFVESRGRFRAAVDEKLVQFRHGHFVELRTALYECAAAVGKEAVSEAELKGMKEVLGLCSAALYINGQRACDPPASVRKRYEEAKKAVQMIGIAN